MFPLITWKEQAICLQKLQAVVITLSLLNFLEEYLIVKRTLTTLISLRCTGNVLAWVRFFSRCIHKMCSYEDVPGYKVRSPTVDTKTKYLCRTRSGILIHTLDRTLLASQITEI